MKTDTSELRIADEFLLDDDLCYLNHAAVSPWPARTVAAVENFARENATQGSRHYPRWLDTEDRLREQLRQLINAPSVNEIALLKNTSEALSVVAFGLPWKAGDNIVSLRGEFPSNRIVWQALQGQGVMLRLAEIDDDPETALFDLVDEHTRLITVSSVQYANGLRLDLARIGAFCRQHDILFCVDAIQSIGGLQFDVQAIQADFVMADGHKWMLGPEGLALFYCREDLFDTLTLRQYGWHMTDSFTDYDSDDWQAVNSARRFECGSPNMLGIHALSASLSLLLEIGMDTVQQQVLQNTHELRALIEQQATLQLLSNTQTGRDSGITTFRHRTLAADRLFKRLTEQGVMCAQRGGGIRFSPHFYTPKEKLLRAVTLAAHA